MKANIQPFYVGQKVVCVDASDTVGLIEGKKYTVHSVHKICDCGPVVRLEGMISLYFGGGFFVPGRTVSCIRCKRAYPDHQLHPYRAARFSPLEEVKLPLMTFTKIQEKEKEEILINN